MRNIGQKLLPRLDRCSDAGYLPASRRLRSKDFDTNAWLQPTVTSPLANDCYAVRVTGWFKEMHARPDVRDAGFTLLELLVVIAILGLLIGLVAPAALRQLGSARTSVARQSIERIGGVLDLYRLDVGGYPTTDQGLRALIERPGNVVNWSGPYLKGNEPVDPWNHPYVFRNPSSRSAREYDLCSEGPSGTGGTEQICNQ